MTLTTETDHAIFWTALREWSTPTIQATPAQLAGIEAVARARRELRQKLAAPACDPGWTRTEQALWKISQARRQAKKGQAA